MTSGSSEAHWVPDSPLPVPLTVATWNVNGIRAREDQLLAWIDEAQPDVLCLQEIKAPPEKVPDTLRESPDHHSVWHGAGGYSGVALLVRRERVAEPPTFAHPPFDIDERAVYVRIPHLALTIASIYVPNGGRDLPGKLRFLDEMREWTRERIATGDSVLICGDLNVTRTDRDLHPKERRGSKPLVGTLPEERERLEAILDLGLVDLGRATDPDNDALFTWWAPWRNLRQRNIGWRIDYLLGTPDLHARVERCVVLREVGTSDHGPVLATFAD